MVGRGAPEPKRSWRADKTLLARQAHRSENPPASAVGSVNEVLKTKGNGNGIVGIQYDAATKTYKEAPLIKEVKADEIKHAMQKQQEQKQKQTAQKPPRPRLEDLPPIDEDEVLPW